MSAIMQTLYWAFSNNTLSISANPIGGTHSGSFSTTTKFSWNNQSPWNDFYLNINTVAILDKVSPQYIQGWFGNYVNSIGKQDGSWVHNIIGLDNIDTSNITDMSKVFSLLNYEDPVPMTLDLNSWDVSNVTNMSYMFFATTQVDLRLDQWQTYSLANASNMFDSYKGADTLDIHYLYFDNLTNVSGMFSDIYCTSIDIRGLNVTEDMTYYEMFWGAEYLRTIYASENWNLPLINDRMFSGAYRLKGAIAYDSNKKSGFYANYLAGYFTYKELSQNINIPSNLNTTNLIDTELRQLDINISVLDYNFQIVDEISGLTTSVSFSIDADSDIRRTANIGMILHKTKSNLDYWVAGNPYWFDKYIKIQTGVKNKDYYTLDNIAEYDNDTAYYIGDVVKYGGELYRCKDTSRMTVDLLDYNGQRLSTSNSETLQVYSGTSTYIIGVPPFNIIAWTKLEEYEWVNQGVYMINAPSISYNATDNTLSFQAVDLMSKLTGMRNGYLEGMTYQIKAGSLIDSSIKALLVEQGFTNVLINTPPINETPIDLNIDIGSTAYDLLTQLRDINPNWEMFFDVNGVFRFQQIPSGNKDKAVQIVEEAYASIIEDNVKRTSINIVNGRSYMFNQLQQVNEVQSVTVSGVRFYNNGDGTVSVNGTSTSSYGGSTVSIGIKNVTVGDKYYICGCPEGGSLSTYYIGKSSQWIAFRHGDTGEGYIGTADSATVFLHICVVPNATADNLTFIPQFINLTKMFGAGNEPTDPAKVKAMLPATYYAYDTGALKHTSVDTITLNSITYTIPSSIQSLDGYGQSNGTSINYVDYTNKKYHYFGKYVDGVWQSSTETITDISSYLTAGFLQDMTAQPNDTLTFTTSNGANYHFPVLYIRTDAVNSDDTPEFGDDVWNAVYTGYNLDTSFEDVKNYVEVVGKQIEPDETATITYNGANATITLARPWASYYSSSNDVNVVWYIGFTIGSLSQVYAELATPIINITVKDSVGSVTQTIVIPSDKPAIYYNNESYFLRLTFSSDDYVDGSFAGYLQPRAIAFDNDPSSPFYVGQYVVNGVTHEASELPSPTTKIHSMPRFNKMVRGVFSGDEYDNIYTNDLAQQRAGYEFYLNCRLHDTINLSCVPLYWLDVNKLVGFTPKGELEEGKWIIKSINTDIGVDGVQSITAMRYYPLYN